MAIVSNPSIAAQNSTVTGNLGPDGCSWPAADGAMVVDQYGKIITAQQQQSDGCWLCYSNDGGANWTDGLQQTLIKRGALAYDSVHDQLHVLWSCQSSGDGILYRRYAITRDGSHNITGIARDANTINLQLDYETASSVTYDFPSLIWMNDAGFGSHGALLAVWWISQTSAGNNGMEIRASMRVLSNDASDATAANWAYPVTDSASTLSTDAQVPYSAIFATTTAAKAPFGAGRKTSGTHALDVYVAYYDPNGTPSYKFRRMRWNAGSSNWSTGLSSVVTLSNLVRSGSNGGYDYKFELITRPREDVSGDKMIVAFATWKDNTNGDAWSYVRINANDSLGSIVDVYSGGASNCEYDIFITGDLAVDAGRVVASYTDLPNKVVYVRAFDSADAELLSPLSVYSATPCDIPTLYPGRVNFGSGDRLCVLFRDFNAGAKSKPPTYTPPYDGYFGTLTWDASTVEGTPLSVATGEVVLGSSAW